GSLELAPVAVEAAELVIAPEPATAGAEAKSLPKARVIPGQHGSMRRLAVVPPTAGELLAAHRPLDVVGGGVVAGGTGRDDLVQVKLRMTGLVVGLRGALHELEALAPAVAEPVGVEPLIRRCLRQRRGRERPLAVLEPLLLERIAVLHERLGQPLHAVPRQ